MYCACTVIVYQQFKCILVYKAVARNLFVRGQCKGNSKYT